MSEVIGGESQFEAVRALMVTIIAGSGVVYQDVDPTVLCGNRGGKFTNIVQ